MGNKRKKKVILCSVLVHFSKPYVVPNICRISVGLASTKTILYPASLAGIFLTGAYTGIVETLLFRTGLNIGFRYRTWKKEKEKKKRLIQHTVTQIFSSSHWFGISSSWPHTGDSESGWQWTAAPALKQWNGVECLI